MIGHDELLARLCDLKAAGILRNADVQRMLALPSSRVTQIFQGTRRIQLDEAITLVRELGLADERSTRLNEQVARLFVLHAAKALQADIAPDQIQALAEDLQGFVEFATGPAARGAIDQAQQFFLGRLRTPRRHQTAS